MTGTALGDHRVTRSSYFDSNQSLRPRTQRWLEPRRCSPCFTTQRPPCRCPHRPQSWASHPPTPLSVTVPSRDRLRDVASSASRQRSARQSTSLDEASVAAPRPARRQCHRALAGYSASAGKARRGTSRRTAWKVRTRPASRPLNNTLPDMRSPASSPSTSRPTSPMKAATPDDSPFITPPSPSPPPSRPLLNSFRGDGSVRSPHCTRVF